jgi:lantibiotic biosynthesis protein
MRQSTQLQLAPQTWQPLLNGNQRERALAVVAELAQSLPEGIVREFGSTAPPPQQLAEAALFYGYLARALGQPEAAQQAIRYLNQAFEGLAAWPTSLKLFSGVTSVAWTVAHLAGPVLAADAVENCLVVDELLQCHLARTPWQADYDLLGGLTGYGVYALERGQATHARECLGLVVDRLVELAETTEAGVTWFTPPALLPAWQRELCPRGYYNLGLAHGVPGVIALLGRLLAADVECERVQPLLAGAVQWLHAQRLPPAQRAALGAYFPSWAGPEVPSEASRLAWCYGDLGAATALLYAARCAGMSAWESDALGILRTAAVRPLETSHIRDACLCHGSAGNAHLFNRLFQATGEPLFAEAAQRWFAQALDFRTPGLGVAGFQGFWLDANDEPQWVAKTGLLEGAVGIGLALLAAATTTPPDWDRLLLVSVPPASAPRVG